MKTLKAILVLLVLSLAWAPCLAEKPVPTFKKLQLTDQFYCEGAYYGDFNKDGKMDVVSGPFWYEGPGFQKKHEFRPAKAYDPKSYSDNFLTFTGDFNGDSWPDIFCMPYPGKEGCWYENPAGKEGEWKKHLAFPVVDNESPTMGDINGDGRPELIFNTGGCLGYATFDPAKVESTLEEDEQVAAPRRGSSRKDPGFKHRSEWPKFYADHKADIDKLWAAAVAYAMATEGLDGGVQVAEEDVEQPPEESED
jgi:hypothetical protein